MNVTRLLSAGARLQNSERGERSGSSLPERTQFCPGSPYRRRSLRIAGSGGGIRAIRRAALTIESEATALTWGAGRRAEPECLMAPRLALAAVSIAFAIAVVFATITPSVS